VPVSFPQKEVRTKLGSVQAYPRFDVGFFLEAHVRSEVVRSGEYVIVDLTGLVDPANRDALRDAVNTAGLAAHVRWYE